jgi:hypothetical protein
MRLTSGAIFLTNTPRTNKKPFLKQALTAAITCLLAAFFLWWTCWNNSASALQSVTPWNAGSPSNFQNLTCGSSTYNDVVSSVGRSPDEIIHSEQMYPLIENFYYFDDDKTGAATVFVFENGLLVGLQYKSAGNQFVDLTNFLQHNGDRALNYSALGGYQYYYPDFQLNGVGGW